MNVRYINLVKKIVHGREKRKSERRKKKVARASFIIVLKQTRKLRINYSTRNFPLIQNEYPLKLRSVSSLLCGGIAFLLIFFQSLSFILMLYKVFFEEKSKLESAKGRAVPEVSPLSWALLRFQTFAHFPVILSRQDAPTFPSGETSTELIQDVFRN